MLSIDSALRHGIRMDMRGNVSPYLTKPFSFSLLCFPLELWDLICGQKKIKMISTQYTHVYKPMMNQAQC